MMGNQIGQTLSNKETATDEGMLHKPIEESGHNSFTCTDSGLERIGITSDNVPSPVLVHAA